MAGTGITRLAPDPGRARRSAPVRDHGPSRPAREGARGVEPRGDRGRGRGAAVGAAEALRRAWRVEKSWHRGTHARSRNQQGPRRADLRRLSWMTDANHNTDRTDAVPDPAA